MCSIVRYGAYITSLLLRSVWIVNNVEGGEADLNHTSQSESNRLRKKNFRCIIHSFDPPQSLKKGPQIHTHLPCASNGLLNHDPKNTYGMNKCSFGASYNTGRNDSLEPGKTHLFVNKRLTLDPSEAMHDCDCRIVHMPTALFPSTIISGLQSIL